MSSLLYLSDGRNQEIESLLHCINTYDDDSIKLN